MFGGTDCEASRLGAGSEEKREMVYGTSETDAGVPYLFSGMVGGVVCCRLRRRGEIGDTRSIGPGENVRVSIAEADRGGGFVFSFERVLLGSARAF